MKEHLNELIEHLVALGENAEELSIWPDLFDAMESDEQAALLANLEKEIESLTNV